jgi:hypothetical protein
MSRWILVHHVLLNASVAHEHRVERKSANEEINFNDRIHQHEEIQTCERGDASENAINARKDDVRLHFRRIALIEIRQLIFKNFLKFSLTFLMPMMNQYVMNVTNTQNTMMTSFKARKFIN